MRLIGIIYIFLSNLTLAARWRRPGPLGRIPNAPMTERTFFAIRSYSKVLLRYCRRGDQCSIAGFSIHGRDLQAADAISHYRLSQLSPCPACNRPSAQRRQVAMLLLCTANSAAKASPIHRAALPKMFLWLSHEGAIYLVCRYYAA